MIGRVIARGSHSQDCSIVDILGDVPVVGSGSPSESAVSGRQHMTVFGRNVFLVGQNFHTASALTDRLYLWKFQCHFANSMRATSELLSSQPVALLLSNTYLSDGTGVAACCQLWHASRLPRSSACRSKIPAFGCPPLTAGKSAWEHQPLDHWNLGGPSKNWLGACLPHPA
jgi:hypothetical protein